MIKKNITIYDIAKEAGVSTSMVSRVVSGNGAVAEKNRIKIQELIAKYDYKPNGMARSLQKSRTGLVGFIMPHIGNEYFSSVYYEFEKLASENGYMTVLYNGKSYPPLESRILQSLEEARVEAIIMMGGRADLVNLEKIYVEEVRNLNKTIPCILATERAFDFGCVGVHCNDRKSCALMVEHLSRQGYKTMGILGGTEQSYPSVFKRRNLLESAEKYGLTVQSDWIIGKSFDERDGQESMEALLKLDKLPEAVCCINDHVAFGALNRALDAGLKVPDNMAIVGFDGVSISSLARPSITTVAIDFETFGRKLYEAMIAAMEQQEYPALSLIDPKLIIRKSSVKE